LFNTVKTDAQGRYISQGLPAGVYRVTLLVNGATKASIANTKTKPDQSTVLNFDLKPVPAGQATAEQKKGKHMVWIRGGNREPYGRHAWLNNTTITLSVNSVMDLEPPFVAGSVENGYHEATANIKGRTWYVALKKRF
jgi:hypothetical protein